MANKLVDIIQLLPDPVANQIAAGEVIQRPASVVKELLENAVDAGADTIQLIVKDSGKTLIQVIDNGCGMSDTDARLCFERHATSKIRTADDLFAIRSFGFRGEAMPSIAAIARVELRSRRNDNELGTLICIESSQVVKQENCSHPAGTSVAVRNIFYNVPARRRFLKSDNAEMRHILEEFQRIALSNFNISFSLFHNDNEIFQLQSSNFRKRISDIYGRNYNERLVPVEVESSITNISGFIGKPEHAKKTRGEQYFFINKRFVKHPYLNHAVVNAFEGLIGKEMFPSYFLLLELNPEHLDINIHPTKTEVKFDDEKALYAIVRSGIKQALGKFNFTPSLDFERDHLFDLPADFKKNPAKIPEVKITPGYNPFKNKEDKSVHSKPESAKTKGWEQLYSEKEEIKEGIQQVVELSWTGDDENKELSDQLIYQLHNKYILANTISGFMLIHQQRAHMRILYEQFMKGLSRGIKSSQQELFPRPVELSSADADLMSQLLEDICSLGIDIRQMGKNTFVIHGLPVNSKDEDPRSMLETILEHYKRNISDLKLESRESLARSMAANLSIRSGKKLHTDEMRNLIDELFSCEIPHTSPGGKVIISLLTMEYLDERFN